MQLGTAITTAWFLVAGSLAAAQANTEQDCDMIQKLDQFQVVQTRLANGPNMSFYVNDIRFLRNQITQIDQSDLLAALGETPRSPAGRALVELLDQTRDLLSEERLADPATTRTHYRDPTVQANLSMIRAEMRRWRCPVEGIVTMESWMVQANSSDIPTPVQAEPVNVTFELTFSWKTILILLGVIVGAVAAFKVYRLRAVHRRRRAKRYSTNFPTVYRVGDDDIAGMLLDISGNGTKLRFDPAHPLAKSTHVQLLIFDDWVAGTVAWTNAHYSGIVFRAALKNATVKNIRAASGNQMKQAA